MKFFEVTILGSAILVLSGCGSQSPKKEVKKDFAYYTQELNKATSIQSLHTDETILFTMNSLEKTLNDISEDINKSTIAEIVYQLHYSLENKVNNVNNFTFTRDTAIILEKKPELKSNSRNKKRSLSKYAKVGLNYELDKASKKVIGKSISDSLPENFSQILDKNEDVNENNSTQHYISFAPELSEELVCPPLITCKKKSLIKQWQRGGLSEVQKLRQEYEKEVKKGTDIVDTKMSDNSNVRNSRSWSCPSDGYSINAVNYRSGGSAINYYGNTYLQYRTREITSYQPFALNESFNALTAPNNGQANSICLTDGSWVIVGETYYDISKYSHKPWANTSSHWEGGSNLTLSDINSAAQALNLFRSRLSANANGPLPTGCHNIPCSSHGSSSGEGSDEVEIDPFGRVSMVEFAMNNPFFSGQDIFNYFRGDTWGTHREDLSGLSLNWISTFDNLGIINGPAIAQEIRDSYNGNFIFKKIEIESYHTFDLTPVDEDVEELLILPRQSNYNAGSFPTNLFYGVPRYSFMPGGRLNPNYCVQLDPRSSSYIPVYLVDSEVLIELTNEVEYLTYIQLDRIESEKNIKIWEQYESNVSHDGYGYGDEPERITYPPRIEYDCHWPTSRDTYGLICQTKDVAYYDALIDRLIILNPLLNGNEFNHPCINVSDEIIENQQLL